MRNKPRKYYYYSDKQWQSLLKSVEQIPQIELRESIMNILLKGGNDGRKN